MYFNQLRELEENSIEKNQKKKKNEKSMELLPLLAQNSYCNKKCFEFGLVTQNTCFNAKKDIKTKGENEIRFSPELENGKYYFEGVKSGYQDCRSKNAMNLRNNQTYEIEIKLEKAKNKKGIFIGLCSHEYNREVYLGYKNSFSIRTKSDSGHGKCDIRNNGRKDIATKGDILEGDKIKFRVKGNWIQYFVNEKRFGNEQFIPKSFKLLHLCIGLFHGDSVVICQNFRRNDFCLYPKRFQNFIIFLLWAQSLKEKEDKNQFSKIPKDCLVYKIFPFMDISDY